MHSSILLEDSIDLSAALRVAGDRVMARREGACHRLFFDFGEMFKGDAGAPAATFARLRVPHATGDPDAIPFAGWVGFFGYELLAAHAGVICRARRDLHTPDALFGRPRTILDWTLQSVRIWSQLPGRAEALGQSLRADAATPRPASVALTAKAPLTCNFDFAGYREVFRLAREAILDGETYQIKISQRFSAPFHRDPVDAYVRLDQSNPAPEAFFVRWDDFALISCSPELVLERRGKHLATAPIGGTVPRSGSASDEHDLRTSAKEMAEHNMLIDLERNDLNRVCRTGSVTITDLRRLHSYAHVHHLVSRIEGELRADVDFAEIARAMLPGGSITGCPKRRTMELIDRFEPCFRGAYTGSFGTLEDNGNHRFNLIIRTLVIDRGTACIQAGGGIVVDSTPEYEYRENTLKAQALLDLLTGQ